MKKKDEAKAAGGVSLTDQIDRLAFRYLAPPLLLLVVTYASYCLVYSYFKGWYALDPRVPTHHGSTNYGSTRYGSTHHGSTHHGSTHYGSTHHGTTHHGTTHQVGMIALFDHEEVGSESFSGAGSPVMGEVSSK